MLLSQLSFGRDIHRIYAGYSWGIHGVYVCIGYVSGMCRVCVGKASKDTGSEKGSQGHGKRGNNYLLRAEREKSKLSKLQTDYYLQQPKQHKPTTHCARNNTASAKGIYVSTMKTMMINNTNNNILWRGAPRNNRSTKGR